MDVLPLLVGAVLAIAGGLVGQLAAFWLKQAETRRNYRRDKLDQVVVSLLEDEHWLDRFRSILCFETGDHPVPEPFDRVTAVTILYFDELRGALQPLLDARQQYKLRIRETRIERIQKSAAIGTALERTPPEEQTVNAVTNAYVAYYGVAPFQWTL